MAKSDFHCDLCKNVGGRNGRGMYKCATHKTLCERCVTSSGFFNVTYRCSKCDKECLQYGRDEKKLK